MKNLKRGQRFRPNGKTKTSCNINLANIKEVELLSPQNLHSWNSNTLYKFKITKLYEGDIVKPKVPYNASVNYRLYGKNFTLKSSENSITLNIKHLKIITTENYEDDIFEI